MICHNSFLKIDLDAIQDNFSAIREKAGVPVMAVVKANAYGHGAVQVARLLEKDCAFFGVASVSEALELRRAGLEKPILILGHTPTAAFPEIVKENIRPAICDYEEAQILSQEAQKQESKYFEIPLGRIELADYLCTDRSALTRELGKMRQEGLIDYDKNLFRLCK